MPSGLLQLNRLAHFKNTFKNYGSKLSATSPPEQWCAFRKTIRLRRIDCRIKKIPEWCNLSNLQVPNYMRRSRFRTFPNYTCSHEPSPVPFFGLELSNNVPLSINNESLWKGGDWMLHNLGMCADLTFSACLHDLLL